MSLKLKAASRVAAKDFSPAFQGRDQSRQRKCVALATIEDAHFMRRYATHVCDLAPSPGLRKARLNSLCRYAAEDEQSVRSFEAKAHALAN